MRPPKNPSTVQATPGALELTELLSPQKPPTTGSNRRQRRAAKAKKRAAPKKRS